MHVWANVLTARRHPPKWSEDTTSETYVPAVSMVTHPTPCLWAVSRRSSPWNRWNFIKSQCHSQFSLLQLAASATLVREGEGV